MIRKTKYSILSAAAGLSLLGGVVAAGAAGGNYLLNGDFSDEWTHWTQYNDTASMGGNEKGGIYIENVSYSEDPQPAIVYQCVDVQAGMEYRFGADVSIEQDQDRPGSARLGTYWWTGENCTGGLLGVSLHTPVTHDTPGMFYHPIAPEHAVSAWAALIVQQDAPVASDLHPEPFITDWDNAYFGRPYPMGQERPEDEGEPVVLEEPENPTPPDEPQVEGERPEDEPGDQPQDEPGDQPQDEPGDEPQDEPGDETQDEPEGDQPLELDEPGEDVKSPLPPDTGSGMGVDSPEVMLAAGVIGAAMAVALGGAMLMPAKRKR